MQDLREGIIGRPFRANIVRSLIPNPRETVVAVATPDAVRYANNHYGVRSRIMLDPTEAMTKAEWNRMRKQILSGIVIDQTVEGFDEYLNNIFAAIMYATRCEYVRRGCIKIEVTGCNRVTDRFHNFAGGCDLVNAINTLIMALRHALVMFSPSEDCLKETNRGATPEEEVVEDIFGSNAEAILHLRRLASNRVKMHDRERLTLLRDNPIWEQTAPQKLRRNLEEQNLPRFPPLLQTLMLGLLNSSQYDTEGDIKERRRGNLPDCFGLILDEWLESASYHPITEDLILEWGSTRGLVTAGNFLCRFGFKNIASRYLQADGPIASAVIASV